MVTYKLRAVKAHRSGDCAYCRFAAPETVSAHPLGNFTIIRYSRLEISAGRITLRYVCKFSLKNG
jgi:hypothetical protein